MVAFAIVRVDVTDPEQYDKYKLLTPAAAAAFGGKFIVRGGPSETLEGEEETRRVVVLEFPDMDSARRFYDSPLYREARAVRAGAADMQLVIVEGAD